MKAPAKPAMSAPTIVMMLPPTSLPIAPTSRDAYQSSM